MWGGGTVPPNTMNSSQNDGVLLGLQLTC